MKFEVDNDVLDGTCNVLNVFFKILWFEIAF